MRDENHGHAVLSSYPPTRGLRNLYDETKIWEACRATSAASTFFEPVTIGRFKERFVDGGLGANNPVQEVWLEAMELFSQGVERFEDRIGCFVSIGTGVPYNRQISANAVSLFKALAYISTDTEQTAARFERERRRLQRDHRYFRWNVNLPAMSEIGLEEEDRLHEIAAATGEYFGRTALNDEVSRCVDQLWNERRKPNPHPSDRIVITNHAHLAKWWEILRPAVCDNYAANSPRRKPSLRSQRKQSSDSFGNMSHPKAHLLKIEVT